MTDFLLVHDAVQGAWTWGRVWGYLTSPVEHPPRLAVATAASQVEALDLGGQEATSSGGLDEWVSAVVDAVGSRELRDLVLVGHGVAAPVVLQAAAQLETPPKRVVLFGGVVPKEGKSPLSVFPLSIRLGFKFSTLINGMLRKEVMLPQPFINHYLCNSMDPFDVIQIVGWFNSLPVRLLRSPVSLGNTTGLCPITYVVLWRDRLLSPELQRTMAERLGKVEVVELNSCHQVTTERPKEVAELLLKYS